MFSKKDLQRLIIPLIIEQFLAITIGMADTVMVSGCGEAAVSGVSLVDAINILLINIFSALATGGAIVSSQYIGREEPHKACEAAKQLVLAVLGLSLIVGAVCVFGGEQILSLIYRTIEPEVMDNAKIYFLLTAMSYPFIALYNAGAALFRAMGNSRISMVTSIFMNCINIAGNAILIYIFDMGAEGAGIASLLSRTVACAFMLYKVTRKKEEVHVEKIMQVSIDSNMIKRILRIALPSGIENSVFHIGKILVSSTVASLGTASIAANAVFNALSTFANIPGTAVGMAAVTVIGQCCGARQYDAASYYGKKLLKLTYLMMGVTCTVMYILTPELTLLYNLSPSAHELAIETTRLNMFQTVIFWPFAFTIPNYLRAAGDARFTMVVSIFSMWAFRVLLSRILGLVLGFGLMGVMWGMFIDWYFRGIVFTIRFLKGKWKTKTVV